MLFRSKSLPGLSQSLLTAAADAATSAQDLARIQGQTAASLEQTVAIINAMAGLSTDAASAAAAGMPKPATRESADTSASLAGRNRGFISLSRSAGFMSDAGRRVGLDGADYSTICAITQI